MDDNVAVPLICDFLVNCDEEIERFLRNENEPEILAKWKAPHVFSFLPERRRQIRTHVFPGVVVFHFLALAFSNEIKDVKVLEISKEVISEVDAVGWVAACCSPVGGVSL